MSREFVDVRVTGLAETLDFFKVIANDQFPFALSKACNDTAFMIRAAEMAKMKEVFDRPNPATVRNIRVSKGSKRYPGATVSFDQLYTGDEYMVPQVDGGKRTKKRSETILGRYWVPGSGAQFDQYGNMKGSQITQILSRLGKFQEVGFTMNERKKTKDRRAGQGQDYFMVTRKTNGLVPGVYQRVDKSQGQMVVARALANKPRGVSRTEIKAKMAKQLRRGVIPVMIFVKAAPKYTKRFPFFEVANKVIDENFPRLMSEAVDYALRTAR